MKAIKHKAFLQAVVLVNTESRKAKFYLNDKRMTLQEKTIIASFLALRDFENQEVIDVLTKMICHDPFVESQRHFCLGAAFNNLTQFKEAEFHLLESIGMNHFAGAELLSFGACQSLFTVYLNTHYLNGMSDMIARMKILFFSFPNSSLYIKGCEFSYAIQVQDFTKARLMLAYMEENHHSLNEHQRISYFYDLFELYLFMDNFKQAESALERIKRFKKYKNSIHTKYMQGLISFLLEAAPIYLYEKDFAEYPLLLNQLICLKSLECGDLSTALKSWNKLKVLEPGVIKDPFIYVGPPNLFSKALLKLTRKSNMLPILNDSMIKEEKLFYLLTLSKGPIQKEMIYQEIWNSPVESKDEFSKLAKLVQRTKEKYGIEIKSLKGSYYLVTKKAS